MGKELKNFRYKPTDKFGPVLRNFNFFGWLFTGPRDGKTGRRIYMEELAEEFFTERYLNSAKLKEYKDQWVALRDSEEGWTEFAMQYWPGIPGGKDGHLIAVDSLSGKRNLRGKKKSGAPVQQDALKESLDVFSSLGNELLQNQPFGAEAVRQGRHARERIQNYLNTPQMEMMRLAFRAEDGAGTDFNHFALLFYPGPEEDLSHFPAETLNLLEQIGPVDKRSGIIQRAFELREDEPLTDFAKENKYLREMRKFSQFSLRDVNKQIDVLRKEEAERIERKRAEAYKKAYKKTAKTGAMLPVDVEGVDTTPTLGDVEPPIQAIDPELSDLIDSPIDQYLQVQQLPFDVDSMLLLLNDEIPSESPEHINNQKLTEAEFPKYLGLEEMRLREQARQMGIDERRRTFERQFGPYNKPNFRAMGAKNPLFYKSAYDKKTRWWHAYEGLLEDIEKVIGENKRD